MSILFSESIVGLTSTVTSILRREHLLTSGGFSSCGTKIKWEIVIHGISMNGDKYFKYKKEDSYKRKLVEKKLNQLTIWLTITSSIICRRSELSPIMVKCEQTTLVIFLNVSKVRSLAKPGRTTSTKFNQQQRQIKIWHWRTIQDMLKRWYSLIQQS